MTLASGQKAPVHKKFNEIQALEHIRNRYQTILEKIPQQVETLQVNSGFRVMCKEFYERGYKDWVILSAIFNCMINWKLKEIGSATPRSYTDTIGLVQGKIFPSSVFTKQELENNLAVFFTIALKSLGFEMRRIDFKVDTVESFLRDRMKFFDLDLPHEPLFGEPPGNWPKI